VISGGKVPSRLTTSRRQIASHAARQQQLAALSAAAKHIVAPNTGHYPHITDPGIVVQAVREIVSSSFWPCGGDADRPLRPNPTALSNPGPAADGAAEGDAQAPVSQCLAASSRGTAEGDHAVIRRRRHVTRVPAFEDQCWDGVQDDAAWPNRPGLPRTSSRLNFRTTRTEFNWSGVRVTVQRCGCWLTGALSPAAGDWGPCSCAERLRSHAGFGDARDNR
jgi:hypothetical protein